MEARVEGSESCTSTSEDLLGDSGIIFAFDDKTLQFLDAYSTWSEPLLWPIITLYLIFWVCIIF